MHSHEWSLTIAASSRACGWSATARTGRCFGLTMRSNPRPERSKQKPCSCNNSLSEWTGFESQDDEPWHLSNEIVVLFSPGVFRQTWFETMYEIKFSFLFSVLLSFDIVEQFQLHQSTNEAKKIQKEAGDNSVRILTAWSGSNQQTTVQVSRPGLEYYQIKNHEKGNLVPNFQWIITWQLAWCQIPKEDEQKHLSRIMTIRACRV